MNLPTRTYPAKVILFGEYTVLLGGHILAVPYPSFAAKWQDGTAQDQRLIDYLNYLIVTEIDTLQSEKIQDLKAKADAGLILQTNLKSGSGLGSSGTLVAAIYDYCKVSDDDKIDTLLETFVKMESYFHGQSSGIDPLVSYTQSAVLKSGSNLTLYDQLKLPTYTLHDSEISRDTKELVRKFKARLDVDPEFRSGIEAIKTLNDQIITSIIVGNYDHKQSQQLSDLQLACMTDFIPVSIIVLWSDDQSATWKICGAGGGGYFLRFED